MAKTGRAVAKLTEKAKRNAVAAKHGRQVAVITRTKSTYAEKVAAFEAHKRAIHGFEAKGGKVHNEGGMNPIPRITTLSKDGKKSGAIFRGDGLPCDALSSARAPKTNAERAKEDKRPPLKSERRDNWTPRHDDWKPFDPVELALAAI